MTAQKLLEIGLIFSFLSIPALAAELTPELQVVKVEAETVSLQISIARTSIAQHFQDGLDRTSEICFDIGQLATYIRLFDLAVDRAHDQLMGLPVEKRVWFRFPLMHRDRLLGACGIVSDPTLEKGNYLKLDERLNAYSGIFNIILKTLEDDMK